MDSYDLFVTFSKNAYATTMLDQIYQVFGLNVKGLV